jgi:dihydroorotate dehydrogenase
MYKFIFRPLFFMLSPEKAHHLIFGLLKIASKLHLGVVLNALFNPKCLHMETEVCGLKFPNKIGIAAGLDKNAEAFEMLGKLGFGHVEIGTVTPKAQAGNPKPRLFRLPADQALINRMGFNNEGLLAAMDKLKKRKPGLIIGGNIGKNTLTPNEDALDDYMSCFKGLYPYVDYLVVNVSCPNIIDLHKLQDQAELEHILSTLNSWRKTQLARKPVFLKVSPDLNLNQVDETLVVVKQNEVDGVIVSNTTTSRKGLLTNKAQIDQFANGGLSGKPVKERATELIRYISLKTDKKLPIIGVGGIFSVQDAQDKLEAGACLVQVYTGFIYEGPAMAKRINKGLLKFQM